MKTLKFEIKDSWRQYWHVLTERSTEIVQDGDTVGYQWNWIVAFETNKSLDKLTRNTPGVRGSIDMDGDKEPSPTVILREYHKMVTDALVVAASSPPNQTK